MAKFLLVTTLTRDGVIQRQMVNLDRVCKMHEVDTEHGARTLIKFFPDETDGSQERPIFARETVDQIAKALGSDLIVGWGTTRKRK